MSRIIRKIGLHACVLSLLGFSGLAFAQATDVQCDQCVDASDIATGSIKNNKIQQFAVQSDKIAKQAVTAPKIAPGAVGTGKIADGAVTADKLGGGVPAEILHGGYDLSNVGVFEGNVMAFDGPSQGGDGSTFMTLAEGDSVLVLASSQVIKDETDTSSDIINGGYEPCYRDFSVPDTEPAHIRTTCISASNATSIEECYAGLVPLCMTSTGDDNQGSVSASFLFQNMPAGDYEFGVCASKGNDGGCGEGGSANFYLVGTKVTVIRTN